MRGVCCCREDELRGGGEDIGKHGEVAQLEGRVVEEDCGCEHRGEEGNTCRERARESKRDKREDRERGEKT